MFPFSSILPDPFPVALYPLNRPAACVDVGAFEEKRKGHGQEALFARHSRRAAAQKTAEPLEGAEKQVHHEEPYQKDEPGAVKHVGEAEEFEDRVSALRISPQVLFRRGLLRQQGAGHATDGDEREQKDSKSGR